MKKLFLPILCITLALSTAGCAGSSPSSKVINQTTGIKDVLQSGIEREKGVTTTTTESSEEPSETSSTVSQIGKNIEDLRPSDKGTDGIDFDLTKYSANMVYAEVYNMMFFPQEYIGKRILVQGQFSYYHEESTGKDYYACFISDAAACCKQGMEFVPAKKVKYPKDFPKVGAEIQVTGIFTTYEEGDKKYMTLKDAEFKAV
jgi:hypothetical protein